MAAASPLLALRATALLAACAAAVAAADWAAADLELADVTLDDPHFNLPALAPRRHAPGMASIDDNVTFPSFGA